MDFGYDEQQTGLIEWAREYGRRVLAPTSDSWIDNEDRERFWAHSRALAEQGFLGLTLPEDVGGGGLPILDAGLVIEELARHCPYTAVLVRNTTAGPCAFIAHLGDAAQRLRYLKPVTAGLGLASICMTEPDAGSAGGEMRTRIRRAGAGWVVTGEKLFVTNADVATVFVVYGRFAGGTDGSAGIGAVLVDAAADGLTVGPPIRWMGGAVYPVSLVDVAVGPEDVLISPTADKVSYGRLMATYNYERLGGLFELLGIADRALIRASGYARERHQFGRPIGDNQAVGFRLADMALRLEAARLLVYRAALGDRDGRPDRYHTSLARIATTEMVQFVTDQAIHIHGGYGLARETGVEWLYRFTRHQTIAGGTSDMHRTAVAAGLARRGAAGAK